MYQLDLNLAAPINIIATVNNTRSTEYFLVFIILVWVKTFFMNKERV